MTVPAPRDRRLRVLHVILVLGETNSQYNEHCLPVRHERDLSICTYFVPKLEAPPEIRIFAGDDTLRGFFRALRAALDAGGYDAIHAHAPQTGFLLPLALAVRPRWWRLRKRLAYTVHDSYQDYKPRNKLLMLLPLATFRRVVFCGRSAFESYPRAWRRLVGARARVVPNAADFQRVDRAIEGVMPSRNGAPFTVVSVGRLEKVKDPATVLTAFERIGDDGARLAYVGAGVLGDDLAQQVDAARLGDRVELAGLVPRDEVFERCARADLFVSASHGEGLPVAVMEAMAAGCPVVLSDIPPHREVADGVDFVPFVAPGDVDGFAREIERFRAMPREERRRIGLQGRDLVRSRYGLATMHAGYRAVYEELG